MLTGKRVLLTGGAGFIGTTLAWHLLRDNEVILYDNLTRDALQHTGLADQPNITVISGDVLDRDALAAAADGVNMIVHMAAIAGVDSVLKSPVHTMRVNLLGTANALDVASQNMATLERFVDFSTSEVFGRYAYKVEETHETHVGAVGEARWTYAVSKLAGEYLAHAYRDEMDLPVTVVRPFNVYGPNQVGVGAIHQFIIRALRDEGLVVHGDGSQIRAWCFVDDIVDAVLRILETPAAAGEVFNIGNPRSVCTTFDLAQRCIQATGSSAAIRFQEVDYKDVEIRIPNIDKAREVLGWEPAVDLDAGLARTVEWYRAKMDAE